MEILEVSSKSGAGMPAWLAHLHDGCRRERAAVGRA
jgi:hypothetical protein